MRGQQTGRHSMIPEQRYFGFGERGSEIKECVRIEVCRPLLHRQVEDEVDPRFWMAS